MFGKKIRLTLLSATAFAFAFAVGPLTHFGPITAAYASSDTSRDIGNDKAEPASTDKGADKSKDAKEAKEAGDMTADHQDSGKDGAADKGRDGPNDR